MKEQTPTVAEIEAAYNAYCKRLGFLSYPPSWLDWLAAVEWMREQMQQAPAGGAVDLGDCEAAYVEYITKRSPDSPYMNAIHEGFVAAWETIEAQLHPAPLKSTLPAICGIVSLSGPNGEPLACGYLDDHDGPHSWSTLPTFHWRSD